MVCFSQATMQRVFTAIYEGKLWGDNKSPGFSGSSGPGSAVTFNTRYIQFVRDFIRNRNVQSVVDVGCGDFRCADLIYCDMADVAYYGIDVYAKLIDHLVAQRSRPNRTFAVLDVTEQPEAMPAADLCIIKDVMQHWPNTAVKKFLDVAITKFKYILVTNDQLGDLLSDTSVGGYHPLHSAVPPLCDYGAVQQLLYPMRETSLIENG